MPNTTSSRPATTASTRDQATCITVAGLAPSRRATSRNRAASPSWTASRARTTPDPSPRTSPIPNATVGSSIPASSAAKNSSCPPAASPARTRATNSRNGNGTGSWSACPASTARTSPSSTSIAVWSSTT